MSWLARSLANTLIADPGDEGGEETKNGTKKGIEERSHESGSGGGEGSDDPIEPGSPGRGVKEDLSELTKTLTRQFWGVASFLAPPPTSQISSSSADASPRGGGGPDPTVAVGSEEAEAQESQRIAGIRSDFAEIGGRFRSGISKLSNNAAVSEISKIASTFLPFGSEEAEEEGESEGNFGGGGAIGVTDEVLAFARNISMHPETWLDFPLFSEFEDSDDFEMSNAQLEHAFAVESHEPRLAALRIELCPSHMSEGCFWKIYFVLLHSRLNRHDAELLSTSQIVEARAMLLQRLQSQTKPEPEGFKGSVSYRNSDDTTPLSEEQATPLSTTLYQTDPPQTYPSQETTTSVPITDLETEKHAVITTEVPIIDKSVTEEEPLAQPKTKDFLASCSEIPIQKYDEDEDGDDWLEEEAAGDMGVSGSMTIPLGNDEDVSFSDLEEEDDSSVPANSKTRAISSQAKDSRNADRTSMEQLNMDDIDVV